MAKKKMFILLVVVITAVFLIIIKLLSSTHRIDLQINSDFRQEVEGCDKIIIRDGCYNPAEKYYSNEALKIFDDPCKTSDFLDSIRFSIFQGGEVCACMGWPAIDFYRKGERILVASIQHELALRTQIRPYDISFTAESRKFFENLVTEIEKTPRDVND